MQCLFVTKHNATQLAACILICSMALTLLDICTWTYEARQLLDFMQTIICIVIVGHSASSARCCKLQPKCVFLSIRHLYTLIPSDTFSMYCESF